MTTRTIMLRALTGACALALLGAQPAYAADRPSRDLAAALRSSHTIHAPSHCLNESSWSGLRQWTECEREVLVR